MWVPKLSGRFVTPQVEDRTYCCILKKRKQQIAAVSGKIVEDFGLKAPLRIFFNFRFKKVTIFYLKWRLQSSLLMLVVQAKQFV